MFEQTLEPTATEFQIDTNTYAVGVYVVAIKDENNILWQHKLIIK